MRRSISFTEPSIGLAAERRTWRFVVTPSVTLPKGTLLKFDLHCKGRPIDWEIPSTNLKAGSNMIWAEIEGGKVLTAKSISIPKSIVPQFEFKLPVDVSAGKKITIAIGTPLTKDERKKGSLSQLTIQRRRPFNLYIDTTGKGNYGEPDEVFTVDIKGNVLHTIRILTPSVVSKNHRFDVILRFEDEYGNLTNNAPENTLIEFSHQNLRDSLKWKLFLPETGFIALPNLYFNEPGVFTIQLKNLSNGQEYSSAPIKCFATESKNLFWGSLHGESERFDSLENIDNCLRHFRDERSFNFYATSSPESAEDTSNEGWKKISLLVDEFDEDDRFIPFTGQQWCGEPKTEGLRLFVFSKDEHPIIRKKEQRYATLKKLYKSFTPKEFISIPSFTMGNKTCFDFNDFAPEFERCVEIYNAWGCSERTSKEGNLFPIKAPSKTGIQESAEGSILKALLHNRRFGFVAGGLDDRSIFSSLFECQQRQYYPGMTAVVCDRLTKNNIFDALYQRHCYATTGERIVLGVSIAGFIMGTELSTETKPGLHINRHVAGYVAGTAALKKVELIRNGEVIKIFKSENTWIDFTYDDMDELTNISLKDPSTKELFSFYYIRVTQSDGHMAWSSPIWVDCLPKPPKKALPKVLPKTKAKKLALPDPEVDENFDDFEEDEEEDSEE